MVALQPGNNSGAGVRVFHAGLVSAHSQHQARVEVQVGRMPGVVGGQHVAQNASLLEEQRRLV